MDYNDNLGQYIYEYNSLVFAWDEEPDKDMSNVVKMLADNYYSHLDDIVRFMLPDLEQVYGVTDFDTIKSKLGKPIIDYDNGRVTYVEQGFDSFHIFEFEFLDDAFEDLQYFSIDG